jgi:hypothetical protein
MFKIFQLKLCFKKKNKLSPIIINDLKKPRIQDKKKLFKINSKEK